MNRLTFVMSLGFGILALSAQLAIPHQSLGFTLPDDVLAQIAQTRNALQYLAIPYGTPGP